MVLRIEALSLLNFGKPQYPGELLSLSGGLLLNPGKGGSGVALFGRPTSAQPLRDGPLCLQETSSSSEVAHVTSHATARHGCLRASVMDWAGTTLQRSDGKVLAPAHAWL